MQDIYDHYRCCCCLHSCSHEDNVKLYQPGFELAAAKSEKGLCSRWQAREAPAKLIL